MLNEHVKLKVTEHNNTSTVVYIKQQLHRMSTVRQINTIIHNCQDCKTRLDLYHKLIYMSTSSLFGTH